MGRLRIAWLNPPIHLGRQFFHYPLFSALGLFVNAAAVRQAGFDVSIIDALYLAPDLPLSDDGTGGPRRLGAAVEDCAEAVARTGPDVVLVYVSLFSHPDRWQDTLLPGVFATLRQALPRTRLGICDCFVGGLSYYPYDAVAVLRNHPEVDFVLTRETELSATAFLRRIDEGETRFRGVPGLAWRGPDGPVLNPSKGPATRIADLDTLPWPAFELLDMEAFFEVQRQAFRADLVHEYHEPRRILPLITSRESRFRCVFCQHSTMPVPWRPFSAGYIEKMVLVLRERFRPTTTSCAPCQAWTRKRPGRRYS
jgi:hypothetical protein